MRILVVGAGAVGGYFGGRLAEAERDVSFLVRPARAAALRAGGLRLVSGGVETRLDPPFLTADQLDGPFDLVLLAVKAYALEGAMRDMATAIGPRSLVLPLLNGMAHLDRLREGFGAGRLLGGLCKVATTLDAEGRVVQLAPMQELVFGGLGQAVPEAVAEALAGAGFTARSSPVILQEMWEKWVMLASLGAVTCLLRGTVGEVEAVPGGAGLARQVLAEAGAIATAAGHPPREAFLAQTAAMLTAPGSGAASSMYRDLMQGLPVEVDHVLVDLVARAAGPVPLLQAAAVALSVYQRRRAA